MAIGHINFSCPQALSYKPMFALHMTAFAANAKWNADQKSFDEWHELPTCDMPQEELDDPCVRFNTNVMISDITPDCRATWFTLPEVEWPETFHPGRAGCPPSYGMRISIERLATIYTERPDLTPCYKRGGDNERLYEEWSALWDASLMDASTAEVASPKKFGFAAPTKTLPMVAARPPVKKLTGLAALAATAKAREFTEKARKVRLTALKRHQFVPPNVMPLCVNTTSLPYWWPKDAATETSLRALFQSTFS